MGRGRSILSIFFAGILSILACIGSGSADTGYRVLKDEYGEYNYDEDGYCVEANLYTAGPLHFAYEFDDAGKAIRRNAVDSSGNVVAEIEKYTYNEAGWLETIWCLDPITNEPEWTYDQSGRGVSAKNYSIVEPNHLFMNAFTEVETKWDENDRLVQMASFSAGDSEDAVRLFAGLDTSIESRQGFESRAEEYAGGANCDMTPDGRYLFGKQIVTFYYDERGRVTKLTEHLYYTGLYNYISIGDDHYTHTVTEYWFDYSNPERVEIIQNTQYQENNDGMVDLEPIMSFPEPIKWEIAYNEKQLPIRVGEINTNIYDRLDCTVTDAQVGYFGYFWNDTIYNNFGELHGGAAGFNLNKNNLVKSFTLKVTGINAQGEEVVYYLQPDVMGRRMVQKFSNGKYTDIPDDKVDLWASFTLNLQEDRDVRVYEKTSDTVAAAESPATQVHSESKLRDGSYNEQKGKEPEKIPQTNVMPETLRQNVEAEEHETWMCTSCDNVNTGNYCSNCGEKRPEATKEWICPNCGKENDGNFCPNCGLKKP